MNSIFLWAVFWDSSNFSARFLEFGYFSDFTWLWNHKNLSYMILAAISFSHQWVSKNLVPRSPEETLYKSGKNTGVGLSSLCLIRLKNQANKGIKTYRLLSLDDLKTDQRH